MQRKRKDFRAAASVAVAVLVVGLIALLATLGGETRRGGIVLPDRQQGTAPNSDSPPDDGFVTLTTENVPEVVKTLSRPACYHQSMEAYVPSDQQSARTEIDLWVRDDIWMIVRRDAGGVRRILTDGETAYLWYEDDVRTLDSLSLPAGVTKDELAGIVTYETIAAASPDRIRVTTYAPLSADSDVYCLYVRMRSGETDGDGAEYWIDLSSGLLTRAVIYSDGTATYELTQTALDLLSQEDASLEEAMTPPVPVEGFSAKTETRQG